MSSQQILAITTILSPEEGENRKQTHRSEYMLESTPPAAALQSQSKEQATEKPSAFGFEFSLQASSLSLSLSSGEAAGNCRKKLATEEMPAWGQL